MNRFCMLLALFAFGCASQLSQERGFCDLGEFEIQELHLHVINVKVQGALGDSTWNITGTVIDSEDSAPLPGALISVSPRRRATTNIDGTFTLKDIGPSETITFEFIGHAQKKLTMEDLLRSIDRNGISTRTF